MLFLRSTKHRSYQILIEAYNFKIGETLEAYTLQRFIVSQDQSNIGDNIRALMTFEIIKICKVVPTPMSLQINISNNIRPRKVTGQCKRHYSAAGTKSQLPNHRPPQAIISAILTNHSDSPIQYSCRATQDMSYSPYSYIYHSDSPCRSQKSDVIQQDSICNRFVGLIKLDKNIVQLS